tara:strand:+ start:557 stop:739 length:183 start_codon:yes stop_codon:yes gene_type:complete
MLISPGIKMYKIIYICIWFRWYMGIKMGEWDFFPSVLIIIPLLVLIFYLSPKTDERNNLK